MLWAPVALKLEALCSMRLNGFYSGDVRMLVFLVIFTVAVVGDKPSY